MRFLPAYAKLLAVVIPLLHRCLRATAIVMAIQSDSAAGAVRQPAPLGRLDGGATVEAIPVKGGGWGLQIGGAGMASAIQDKPVQLEFWSEAGQAAFAVASYDDWSEMNGGFRGKATLDGPGGGRFHVEDHWHLQGAVLQMARTVSVVRHAPGGFLSGFTFDFTKATVWQEADWFAPGMIYGGFAHLSDAAIGGRRYYLPGAFAVRIREDRLPGPLFAAHFSDGTSLAVLNPAPRGDTTAADAHDTKAVAMIDGRFQFGAIGAEEHAGKLSLGYWFPGQRGRSDLRRQHLSWRPNAPVAAAVSPDPGRAGRSLRNRLSFRTKRKPHGLLHGRLALGLGQAQTATRAPGYRRGAPQPG